MVDKEKEKKNAKDKYLNKNSTKNGVLSVIGAITHKLGISSIWVIANLATYIISYLKQNNPSNTFLGQTLCYFFNPILTTTLNIFMPICGILEFKLGCQRAIILGGLVIMAGYGLLFISGNIFLDFFSIFLFGIGLSISTTLSTKNAIQYFFNQRGAISGVLELISSGLSATHNKIAESMINPNGEEPKPIPGDTGSKDNYYSKELSENVLNFFLLELGTFGVSTLLTLLFLVPYDEKAAKKLSKELKKKAQEKGKEENNNINEDENKKDDDKGFIFGGYASIPWTSDGNYHKAPDCFIFTLTNIHNTDPTKFPTKDKNQGTYHVSEYGPTFGEACDIYISSDYINSNSSSDYPCRYKDILGKGKSIFTGDFNNNNGSFKLKEIEVFLLSK